MLLDTSVSLERINKYKLKYQANSWIKKNKKKTLDLKKSVKTKLLTNFINKKNPVLKEEFHTKYKKYINLLSTLTKKSKLK